MILMVLAVAYRPIHSDGGRHLRGAAVGFIHS